MEVLATCCEISFQ